MTSKQRLLNALRRQPVDRVPFASLTTGITVEMQEKRGIHWPQAHRDTDQLAGLAEAIHLYTASECIKLPFCMTIEVEALGAEIDFRTHDTVPTETGPAFKHPDELIIPDDFFDRGRVPIVLNAISKLRKRYDNECVVVSSIVGPFSIAEKIFGFGEFLTWTISDPAWVHQAMKKLTPLAIQYAQAQVNAGSEAIIIGEAGCAGDLISPLTYRDFILPYHKELCAAISVPTVMHICGKSTKHTEFIAQSGTTAYNFDEGVNIDIAHKFMDGNTALTGYVPTIQVLLDGTPDDVYKSAWECLAKGVDVLTPGCAMAPHTPLVNIQAMAQAAEDWAKAHPKA
jgi:[methyl-Co(III) methanol-specific corrinoid protein]:coenzyme M methyltransferase